MLTTAFSLPCTSWDASGFDSLLQPDDSPPQAADGGLGLSVEEDLGNPLQGGALLKQAGGSHNSVKRNNSDSELLASITVETSTTSNSLYEVGSAWVQGHRSSMEDSHTVELTLDAQSALLGVFDGHGGAECAEYCQRHAADVLRSTPGWAVGDVARALKEAFLQLDQQMASACPSSSGTTCTVAVLQGHRLAVAGVGDSKCVLFHNKAGLGVDGAPASSSHFSHSSRHGAGSSSGGTSDVSASGYSSSAASSCGSGSSSAKGHAPPPARHEQARQHRALSMTVDHKPDMPEEEERIRCAGGFVYQGRINCCLNVSRALGDAQFKQDAFRPACEQQVSPEPDIREALVNTTSDFLLLCSDGVWNSMKEKVVLRFVKQRLARGHAPADVCRDLCKVCLEPCRTAYDNCTAILVTFKPPSVCQPHLDPSGAPPSRLHNPYHQNSPRHHIHRHQHQQQQFGRQYQELQEEQGARAHAEGGAAPRSHSSGEESPSLSPMGGVCVHASSFDRSVLQAVSTSPSLSPMGASSPACGSPSPPPDTDMRDGSPAAPSDPSHAGTPAPAPPMDIPGAVPGAPAQPAPHA